MTTDPVYGPNHKEFSEKEMVLIIQDWLKYFISKRLVLMVLVAAGCVTGLVYALLTKPLFTATTTFVLESNDSRGSLSRFSGVASLMGLDLGGSGGGLFQGDNILELYKSRAMLSQTLFSPTYQDSTELLIERFIDIYDLRDDWDDRPELLAIDFKQDVAQLDPKSQRLREGVISSIVSKINSEVLLVDKPEKSLSIIRVEVESPNEVFSKSFNENLVRNVNEFYTRTKTKKSTDNIVILEKKVDSVRSVMSGAIHSVAKISDAMPNLNPTRQAQRTVPSQEAQFTAETNKAILAQLLQNLELSKLSLLQEQPLIQLVDQPIYPLRASRVGKIKGMIVGGVIFGFLGLVTLFVRRYYLNIMSGGSGVSKNME